MHLHSFCRKLIAARGDPAKVIDLEEKRRQRQARTGLISMAAVLDRFLAADEPGRLNLWLQHREMRRLMDSVRPEED